MTESMPMRRSCGVMEVYKRLEGEFPEYKANIQRLETTAKAYRAMAAEQKQQEDIVIPVVVHIVMKDPSLVTDAQVKSQIDVLNRDFNKKNTDLSSAPAPFKSVAGNAKISFKLATKDQNDSPTSGIIRVITQKHSFGQDDKVKFTAQGGSDAWPTNQFLNIWVCQLANILGYAQFPGGPAATDGVVILHSAFGTTGTATAPFNLGRTTTHEIGHFLNLRHIWGDSNDCIATDFVDDTPSARDPNYGKPSYPHPSCPGQPNGDMFVNFMDYVDDDVMVMFTEGQVDRMRSAIQTMRSDLIIAGAIV